MNKFAFTPPAKVPSVLLRGKAAYEIWLRLYRKFPKPERFGLGQKMDVLFLETLESLFLMRYASFPDKKLFLEQGLTKVDRLKFFSEVAWETKLITARQHGELLEQLAWIGRELGGWKKSLDTKTSALSAEERK